MSLKLTVLVLLASCCVFASAASQRCSFNYQCDDDQKCIGSASSCKDSSIALDLSGDIYLAVNCLLGNGDVQLRIKHLTSTTKKSTAITDFTSKTLKNLDIKAVLDGVVYGVIGRTLKRINLNTNVVANIRLDTDLVDSLVGGLLDGLIMTNDMSSLIAIQTGDNGIEIALYGLDINLLGLVRIQTKEILVTLDIDTTVLAVTLNANDDLIVLSIDADTKEAVITVYADINLRTESAPKTLAPSSVVDGTKIVATVSAIFYSSDDGIHKINIATGVDVLIWAGGLVDDLVLRDLHLFISIGSRVITLNLDGSDALRLDVTLGLCVDL